MIQTNTHTQAHTFALAHSHAVLALAAVITCCCCCSSSNTPPSHADICSLLPTAVITAAAAVTAAAAAAAAVAIGACRDVDAEKLKGAVGYTLESLQEGQERLYNNVHDVLTNDAER
eukprot:COSAG06_NODE_3037_length_5932_cov_39.020744_5_plen_117_part_00